MDASSLVLVMSGTNCRRPHSHSHIGQSDKHTHKHQSNSLTDFIFSYFTCIVFAGSEWHILPTTFVHKYFHSQSKCGLCSLWTFSVFMKQLDEPKISRLQPEHSVWITVSHNAACLTSISNVMTVSYLLNSNVPRKLNSKRREGFYFLRWYLSANSGTKWDIMRSCNILFHFTTNINIMKHHFPIKYSTTYSDYIEP